MYNIIPHNLLTVEIDPVPESQELSLRLTPSQSDKSSKGTDTETVVNQPIRRRLPMVRSQDLVTGTGNLHIV